METDVRQRIIGFLKSNSVTANSLAQGDSSLQRKLQRQINEGATITIDTISLIAKTFPSASLDWLLTGDGSMLREDEKYDNESISSVGIPYFENDNFECGTPAGFGGALDRNQASGLMNIPGIKQVSNSFLVRAHGISMINRVMPNRSIPDGAWVALQKCQTSAIRWGEVYALATADGFMIKKLMPSEREGYVRCVSFNEQDGYLPFELRGEEIYDFAMVIGVVNVGLW